MSELKRLQAHLAFETEVLEDCKQAAKADPSSANRANLRDARETVRTLKNEIEIVRS